MRPIEGLTYDRLMAKCEWAGEHLEWTGYALNGRHPQIRMHGAGKPPINVRRALWELVHGPIAKGLQIGVKCGNELCVHPDCLVKRTKSKAQRGYVVPLERRIRTARTKQAASKKLSVEIVRQIRESEEASMKLDERYGLSPGYASRIKTNRAWKDFSSPFAGLMR